MYRDSRGNATCTYLTRPCRSSQLLFNRQLAFVLWTPGALLAATWLLWSIVHLTRLRTSRNNVVQDQVHLSLDRVAMSGLDCTGVFPSVFTHSYSGYCSSMMTWLYALSAPIMTRYFALALSCRFFYCHFGFKYVFAALGLCKEVGSYLLQVYPVNL